MAIRGPKPKPAALLDLRGTRVATPSPGTPAPTSGATPPPPPRNLNRVARRVWRSSAPELHRLGLLTQVDGALFGAFCASIARWLEAEEKIQAEGAVIYRGPAPTANPWVSISRAALRDAQSIGAEFGLTPAARRRVETKLADAADPLGAFLAARAPNSKSG